MIEMFSCALLFQFICLVFEGARQTRPNWSTGIVSSPWCLRAVQTAAPQTWILTGPSAVWAPPLSSVGRPKPPLKHSSRVWALTGFMKPTNGPKTYFVLCTSLEVLYCVMSDIRHPSITLKMFHEELNWFKWLSFISLTRFSCVRCDCVKLMCFYVTFIVCCHFG